MQNRVITYNRAPKRVALFTSFELPCCENPV